ncbi:hypothetical protein JG550_000228 [Curtobacterium flaccumfaciens pv. flaccumfaciens]|uniref:hypothetical protein n=1 Tax=Curtobacterium flaccumfaciens TaxID=2035 RepID=UPI001ADBAA41|nr:hypothetical protein [Curtobacterium flaccumfaciens]MBO9045804.1 hypothetical protein [Curtobacterium flaccumfaciens pv. flaccumfaciens]QTR91025.1 hypothetical protein JG550_000228 [Curtobacterium flaccumfaciens pv. flaccumfaciens]
MVTAVCSTPVENGPLKASKSARTPEQRKKAGRIANGGISLVLVFVAFGVAYTTIGDAANAGLPLTGYGSASGLAVATMAVGAARALVSMVKGGRRRVWLWAVALIAAGLYSLIFVQIGGVKATSFALVLSVFAGPIVQDLIEG